MKTTPSDPSLVTFVDALTKFLDEHEPSIASTAPALTALDKKRRAKFRLGGEKAVPVIAALVTKYGLESGVLRPAVMTSRLADAEGLVPIQKRMEALTKRLGDEIFNARSACWEETTNGYVQLARLAKKNGEIETALETVKAYFARRFKKDGAREGADKKPSQKATVAGDEPGESNAPPHPVEA